MGDTECDCRSTKQWIVCLGLIGWVCVVVGFVVGSSTHSALGQYSDDIVTEEMCYLFGKTNETCTYQCNCQGEVCDSCDGIEMTYFAVADAKCGHRNDTDELQSADARLDCDNYEFEKYSSTYGPGRVALDQNVTCWIPDCDKNRFYFEEPNALYDKHVMDIWIGYSTIALGVLLILTCCTYTIIDDQLYRFENLKAYCVRCTE
eukprot:836977_1